MTRSRIQKMKFFIFLLIFLLAQTAVCDGTFREKKDASPALENKGKEDSGSNARIDKPVAAIRKNNHQQSAIESSTKTKPGADIGNGTHNINSKLSTPTVVAAAANKTAHTASTTDEHGEGHTTFNTGALVRGFLVFVGLSILVMAYIVFRSFRLNKTRAQMVRKYGVLTHRQDVEMRPLPLEEEDDEDTTVFDASNVLTNNVPHQNA